MLLFLNGPMNCLRLSLVLKLPWNAFLGGRELWFSWLRVWV
jgi:hypothetical protein